MTLDEILDEYFFGISLAAFVEVWAETGIFPPDSEMVRQRAYSMYEEELARKAR